MNDPIISPWIIYLIDLVFPITFVAAASAVVSFFAAGFCLSEADDGYNLLYKPECAALYKKRFASCKKICIVSVILAVFIPSKATIYKMIAASYVTPANIQATGELADKAVDKVIDKIADAIQKFERNERK